MDYHWLTRKCDGDCENCDPGACRQADEAGVRESWLRACGDFCAADGTCSCAKFADDPTKCERRKEWERTYGVTVVDDQTKGGAP